MRKTKLYKRFKQWLNKHAVFTYQHAGFKLVAEGDIICFPTGQPCPYTMVIEQGKITVKGTDNGATM